MPVARKIISTLLLLAMLGPFLFCIITKIKEQHLKHEARENLEKLFLGKIIIRAGEFQRTYAHKEITINGDLFDVKSYSCENGIFVFQGLFDQKETLLNKLKHDSHTNQEDNKLLTELFQVLQSLFHNLKGEESLYNTLARRYPYLIPNKLPLPPAYVITPPPQA